MHVWHTVHLSAYFFSFLITWSRSRNWFSTFFISPGLFKTRKHPFKAQPLFHFFTYSQNQTHVRPAAASVFVPTSAISRWKANTECRRHRRGVASGPPAGFLSARVGIRSVCRSHKDVDLQLSKIKTSRQQNVSNLLCPCLFRIKFWKRYRLN